MLSRGKPIGNSREDAYRASELAGAEIDGVEAVGKKADETLRYLRWWQFLDYDMRAAEFLKNLDLTDSDVAQ